MIFKLLILTIIVSAGAQTIPNVEQKPIRPEQAAAWAYHYPGNAVQAVVAGSPVEQQYLQAVAQSNNEQQTTYDTHPVVVDNTGVHAAHLHPASEPAGMNSVHGHDIEKENYDSYYEYQPIYEDQVTVHPYYDEEDTSEEHEVWPPVGIFPPPPPPPVRPTYYPPHYPATTKRPTRPTTVRPRPPKYPTIYPQHPTTYPKPPHYPQYPSILPLPDYPQPTTARPTTTKRPHTTTKRPIYTTTPVYQKPGGGDDVVVLENYQIISDKGIKEYKLRLSNGLSDYKKITKKHIGKKTIYVQSGYYSVPVDPKKNKFNIIHYIADEKGYRIVGVQPCSSVHKCRALEE